MSSGDNDHFPFFHFHQVKENQSKSDLPWLSPGWSNFYNKKRKNRVFDDSSLKIKPNEFVDEKLLEQSALAGDTVLEQKILQEILREHEEQEEDDDEDGVNDGVNRSNPLGLNTGALQKHISTCMVFFEKWDKTQRQRVFERYGAGAKVQLIQEEELVLAAGQKELSGEQKEGENGQGVGEQMVEKHNGEVDHVGWGEWIM